MARGNIRQRGAHSYELRVYLGVSPDGRARYKTETVRGTRSEADRRLRQLLDEVEDGGHRAPGKTVADLLDAWLEAKGPSWSPSTLAMARSHVKNYLRPHLGPIRLAKLDPAMIDRLYGEMRRCGVGQPHIAAEPLAPSTIRRVHGTLHLALEQAVAWGWLARNPATRASPPPARQSELTPPDVGQVIALIERARQTNPGLAAFLQLAAAAGPRRGEIAGLRSSDIDREASAVVFRRSILLTDTGVVIKPYPKGRVARRVALDQVTLAVLEDQITRMAMTAATVGTDLIADPWVFSHDLRADQPPRPDAFTRAFMRLRDRMGLTVRLHDLRHFHATDLLTSGTDVRTVAGRLGHASPVTTLNIYAGWVAGADREAAERIGARLSRGADAAR